ncbi:alpha/beta hydrolase-fold protein [Candidatus Cloacimonadota bacterium]
MKNLIIFSLVISGIFLTAVEEEPVIIGKKITLNSEIMQEDREILLYLPGDYDTSVKNYPILFHMQGSEILFHKETGTIKYLSEFRTEIPQMIVVNILFTNYRRDVFPRKLERIPGTGGSDNFLDFIEYELLPFLQENYRTTDHLTIYGQSNTGMFSLYAQLSRPDLFDACIASSPAVGQGNNFMYSLTDSLLSKSNFSNNKMFITHALDDPLKRIVGDALPGYLQILEAKSLPELDWNYLEYENGGHCPPVSLHDGLVWLFSDWILPEEIRTESVQAIISYAEELQSEYGIAPEISDIIEDVAFDLINSQQYEKSYEYFHKLTELKPEELLYHYQIGKISAVSGLFTAEGITSLEMYIASEREDLNPSRSAACWRLGLIYEKMGDHSAASSSYNMGLKLDPNDTYCAKALEELEK